MSSPRLTNTSYVVLGLVEVCQPATPYDLKRFAEISVFNFWSVPHTQIYTESARLAAAGLLEERREETGRRRRIYRLTAAGRKALEAWRGDAGSFEPLEFRDAGLIKLFFGADAATLAASQLAGHERKLREFEQLHAARGSGPEAMPEGMRLALEVGIACERELVRFWRRLADRSRDG
jgi:DNA-binding PadR family transcriptional regulator